MEMTNTELLDLLREARKTMRDFAENWDCDTDAHKYGTTCRVCAAQKAKDSIDAALASHAASCPSQRTRRTPQRTLWSGK